VAQINLLKQGTAGPSFNGNTPKVLIWFFLGVFLIVLGYYGWLFVESKSLDNKLTAAETQINNDSQAATTLSGRGELFTTQQQLQGLATLISSHVYWSQLFQPLADATLKDASYSSLNVDTTNGLTLSVTVPSLEDLDKYMQTFNLPVYNKNFSNLHIGGFSKVQSGNSSSIMFQVQMQFNPQLIQYQPPSNNAS
jgi:hypothetical protein